MIHALVISSLLCSAAAAPEPREARVIHVVVALADNATQGIVPVPALLGNGDDTRSNLYWGARYGVRTFFERDPDWRRVAVLPSPAPAILERVVFAHRREPAFLVADAYRGAELRRALGDFLDAAAGARSAPVELPGATPLRAGSDADLLVWVGHDGLMDFDLDTPPAHRDARARPVVVLACMSREYFGAPLRAAGARPVLLTTGLLAPEAYVLSSVVAGWLAREDGEQIRERAATAYHRHQHCGLEAGRRLFVTGW
jgi:hypothetical protein